LISRAGAWTSLVAWIKDNGYREILEARLVDFEYSLFFEDFFDDLKERCLRGVKLIVSDGLKVIHKEIGKSFLDQAFRYIASSNKTSAQDGAKKEAKISD
jgi:transposase-like protein